MRRAPGRTRKNLREQRGQTATEYLMVVSVIVIALAAVSYEGFFAQGGPIEQGLQDLLGQNQTTSNNIPNQVRRGYISSNP